MLRAAFFVFVGMFSWGRLSLGFVVPCSRITIPFSDKTEIMLRYSNVMQEEQKEALKSRLPPIKRQGVKRPWTPLDPMGQTVGFILPRAHLKCVWNPD